MTPVMEVSQEQGDWARYWFTSLHAARRIPKAVPLRVLTPRTCSQVVRKWARHSEIRPSVSWTSSGGEARCFDSIWRGQASGPKSPLMRAVKQGRAVYHGSCSEMAGGKVDIRSRLRSQTPQVRHHFLVVCDLGKLDT